VCPGMVNSVISPDQLMGSIPSAEETVISAELEKRNQDHRWHARRVIVTPNTLLVLRCGLRDCAVED
jgi:hypothetical protein